MANEITVTIGLSAVKANAASVARAASARQHDWSGATVTRDVTEVATTSAGVALDLGSVSNSGWALFENLDSTNYVEVGVQVSGTFYPFLRLLAGERAVCRVSQAATLYARANTSAVKLDFTIMEA